MGTIFLLCSLPFFYFKIYYSRIHNVRVEKIGGGQITDSLFFLWRVSHSIYENSRDNSTKTHLFNHTKNNQIKLCEQNI